MLTNEDKVSSEIENLAAEAELKLIPAKSKDFYYKEYEKLLVWMEKKDTQSINESVMLAYMMDMSKIYKSSTLWCIHSKLQAMLRIKSGIDLASYHKLRAFMKGTNKGYEPRKSLVFTEDNLRKFFIHAPDDAFLFLKVVAICGIFGSCRRSEMCDLRMSDIRREGCTLLICIRPSKTEKGRKFSVVDDHIEYVQMFNKYLSLRPKNVSTDRVFLKYTKGKCIKQVVGINTFGRSPSLIARFLDLPDADKYTGHAFRRTSATFMVNGGMSVDELKRQVGWKSSAVASGYIEESLANKIEVSKLIAGAVNKAGTSAMSTSSVNSNKPNAASTSSLVNTVDVNNIARRNADFKSTAGIQISNNQNCTFNIYLK